MYGENQVKRLIAILLIPMLTSLACSMAFPALSAPPTSTPAIVSPGILPETGLRETPTQASASNLSVEQLRNATFTISGADQQIHSIHLKDGKYEQGTDPAKTDYISISMGEQIAFGDLNADGQQDAVISLAENHGGTGVFVSVVAVLNKNGHPDPVSSTLIDDRAIITGLKIVDAEILVEATIHGPADPMCCPTVPSRRSYRLVDKNLVLSSLSTKTQNGAERIIRIDSPANGVEISGPFTIKGSVSISPFENSLVYKIYKQGSNDPLDMLGFTINADGLGGPGTFELALDFSQKDFRGPMRIEISDSSPADGSTLALCSLYLTLK
jgi:hypothetical protein